MDWIASGTDALNQMGRLTVVVQDNSSIHKRDIVRQQHLSKDQNLFLFFRLTRRRYQIEDQWHQLKAHKLKGTNV